MWSFNAMITYFCVARHAHLAGKASIAPRHKGVTTDDMKAKNNGGQDARR
jgi:hypothetical protein